MDRDHMEVGLTGTEFTCTGSPEQVTSMYRLWLEGSATEPSLAQRLHRIEARLDLVLSHLKVIERKETVMSKELDDLVLEVTEVKGAAQSGAVAIKGLADALNGILADATDYATLKAGVEAQVVELHGAATVIGDAIAANPIPAPANPMPPGSLDP